MKRYRCPCCGFYTFTEEPKGENDICPVCFWEDDRFAYRDPDFVFGCNRVSFNQARANFAAFGACREDLIPNCRKPRADELPENNPDELI